MLKILKWYVGFIGKINKNLVFLAWIVFPIGFIMLYEVFARYLFNSPTRWAWDVNTQLQCLYVVLAGGYVMYHDKHIRSDLFYAKWSTKRKAWVDLAGSLLLLCFLGAAMFSTVKDALRAVRLNEHLISSLNPPIYPLKIVMVMGVFLFLLQAVAELLKNLLTVMDKVEVGS
jgi:TRAP-type mannitol/chloroaromatic compound transport system permease small subunit